MSRYIDVDKLISHLEEGANIIGDKAIKAQAFIMVVKAQQIADVVEVVRCKDCIKKDTPKCAMWYDCGKCKGQWSWCNPNDFCSYGERSENGKGTDN